MRDITRLAVTCSLVLFAFQGLAEAQLKSPDMTPQVKASITLDFSTFAQDKPAIVTITVENISGKELELSSRSAFDLRSLKKESVERKRVIVGDSYWSPVEISTGRTVELEIIDAKKLKKGVVVGRVPYVTLRFAKDETKTFKVDLTKTFWNDSLYSMFPHETIFKVVPKGSYSLRFELKHRGVNVESNEVKVSVE